MYGKSIVVMYYLVSGYQYCCPAHSSGGTEGPRQWPIISQITASMYVFVCMWCVYTHIRTSLPRHTARSVTASDQLSSLLSIIHVVCGLAGTLFISWLYPVLLSGSALQSSTTQPSPLCLCGTLHLGLFITPTGKVWACRMKTDKQGVVVIALCNNWCWWCAHLHSLACVRFVGHVIVDDIRRKKKKCFCGSCVIEARKNTAKVYLDITKTEQLC